MHDDTARFVTVDVLPRYLVNTIEPVRINKGIAPLLITRPIMSIHSELSKKIVYISL